MALIRILDTQLDDVRAALKVRTIHRDASTEQIVKAILDDVRQRGDVALHESSRKFDAPGLESIHVTAEEIERASVEPRVEQAIQKAADRIRSYHEAQKEAAFAQGWERVGRVWEWKRAAADYARYTGGPYVGQRATPVLAGGVYVPGGNARYPSSVLMNAIPAKVAEVERVVVTTPAQPDGTLAPAVLVAMRTIGVTEAIKVGGAAAIAALALGTETIGRVDKIVGPGNRFVNEAKRQLWGQVGVDGYAGPSEVCVAVDETSNSAFAAADLITQVEHAPDNAGFLVALSRSSLDAVLAEVERQLSGAPRAETIRTALAEQSLAIVVRDWCEAIEVINLIAPEHLTIAVSEPEPIAARIQNAGCILLGEYTPESAGDYVNGPSHTLPTSGAARWQSPVNTMDFIKFQSITRHDRSSLAGLIETVETFGEIEGFPGHAFGATVRRP